ncbi:MAG: hypothetical protein WA154_00155 [Moraxellaceae bacterium]
MSNIVTIANFRTKAYPERSPSGVKKSVKNTPQQLSKFDRFLTVPVDSKNIDISTVFGDL